MTVIADTSPIIALHNLGELDLLHKVYGQITITDKVAEEMQMEPMDWMSVTSE